MKFIFFNIIKTKLVSVCNQLFTVFTFFNKKMECQQRFNTFEYILFFFHKRVMTKRITFRFTLIVKNTWILVVFFKLKNLIYYKKGFYIIMFCF